MPTAARRADQSGVGDCDRLAGSPFDPNRVTDGVPFEKIDTARATLRWRSQGKSRKPAVSF
jgi:hypothetical protein